MSAEVSIIGKVSIPPIEQARWEIGACQMEKKRVEGNWGAALNYLYGEVHLLTITKPGNRSSTRFSNAQLNSRIRSANDNAHACASPSYAMGVSAVLPLGRRQA